MELYEAAQIKLEELQLELVQIRMQVELLRKRRSKIIYEVKRLRAVLEK